MDAVIGQLITAGATSDQALVLTNLQKNETADFICEVVSGTIQFGKDSVHASAHGYTAGQKFALKCKNGELHFKAASAADTFTASAL